MSLVDEQSGDALYASIDAKTVWVGALEHPAIREVEEKWKNDEIHLLKDYRRTLTKLVTASMAQVVISNSMTGSERGQSISEIAARVSYTGREDKVSAKQLVEMGKEAEDYNSTRQTIGRDLDRLGPAGYGLLDYVPRGEDHGKNIAYRIRASDRLLRIFDEHVAPQVLEACVSLFPTKTDLDRLTVSQRNKNALTAWRGNLSSFSAMAEDPRIQEIEQGLEDPRLQRRRLVSPRTAATVEVILANSIDDPQGRQNASEIAAWLCYSGLPTREKEIIYEEGKWAPDFKTTQSYVVKVAKCLGPDGYGLLDYPPRRENDPYDIRASELLLDVYRETVVPRIVEACRSGIEETKT